MGDRFGRLWQKSFDCFLPYPTATERSSMTSREVRQSHISRLKRREVLSSSSRAKLKQMLERQKHEAKGTSLMQKAEAIHALALNSVAGMSSKRCSRSVQILRGS